MKIKWLHLSDIHFNYKNFESHQLRKAFLFRIKSLQESEQFTHLFLSGDILYRNQEADEDTIAFVKELIHIMQIKKENVFIVPGNHDHNRETAKSIIEDYFENSKSSKEKKKKIDDLPDEQMNYLLGCFGNFNDVYNSIFNTSYYAEDNNPHRVINRGDYSIVELNTSWLDKDSKNSKDYLLIGSRQLQLKLSKCEDELKNTVNIAVGHHSLSALMPEERERVLSLFQDNNIGIYFCGHEHQPNINYFSEYDVVEFIAPGGYYDDYSDGGYIIGIINTECDIYRAEVYGWYNREWCIESKLKGTDSYGMYYFHTKKFNHKSNIAVVDCKTMNGHIARDQIEKALNIDNFDLYTCDILPTNSYNEDSVLAFSKKIEKLIENNYSVHIFPLAPIPMLVLLGFNLQHNSKLVVHQFNRESETWVYNEADDNISINNIEDFVPQNDILAVTVSASFIVNDIQVKNAMLGKKYDIIRFKTNRIEPGYPLYKNDVERVANQIMEYLDRNVSQYKEIHLFAAIPAGLSLELGRRMLNSVYSNVHIYQLEKNEYVHSLVINPHIIMEGISNIEKIGILNGNENMLPILGNIACSKPSDSFKDCSEYYPMYDSILGAGVFFVLKARGDSMIDAGIDDGDYVVIKSQDYAENGQIVVALIDSETTLKTLYHDDELQKIVLHPENSKYPDLYFDEIQIQGIAVNVIKRL